MGSSRASAHGGDDDGDDDDGTGGERRRRPSGILACLLFFPSFVQVCLFVRLIVPSLWCVALVAVSLLQGGRGQQASQPAGRQAGRRAAEQQPLACLLACC